MPDYGCTVHGVQNLPLVLVVSRVLLVLLPIFSLKLLTMVVALEGLQLG